MTVPEQSRADRPMRSRGKATMDRLLVAGTAVFREKGVLPARVEDIAAEAGTSTATFYLYFTNKEALFEALAQQTMAELEAFAAGSLEIGTGRKGWAALNDWVRDAVGIYRRNAPIVMGWSDGLLTDPVLLGRGVGVLQRLAEEFVPYLHPDDTRRNPTVVGLALIAVLERTNHLITFLAPDTPLDEVVNTLTSIVWTGFLQRRIPTAPR